MLDNLPVLSWRGLPDGVEKDSQPPLHEYTGLSSRRRTARGGTHHPSDDVTAVAKKWLESVVRRGEVEARLRGSTASYRVYMQGSAIRDEQGNIVCVFGTDTEIEDRKQAEEKLRRSEGERSPYDAIPRLIVVLEPTHGRHGE